MASADADVVMDKKEEEVEKKEEEAEKKEEEEEEEEEAEAEEQEEEEAAPAKPKELEEDAAADSRKKLAANVAGVNLSDTTLNVVPSAHGGGQMLTALSDSGMQYLLAGARAKVGLKSGRYAFEVQLLETFSGAVPANSRSLPMTLVRIGLSTAGSPLLFTKKETGVYFDTEGTFGQAEARAKVGGRSSRRGQTLAVLVNLDSASPNANTLSLFVDGKRASKPQAIPESLLGKTLFPTVAYRGATLRLNLGPQLLKKLPFVCRAVGDAAEADVEVAKPSTSKAKEVVVPVGLPGEGPFDFLDNFLAKNPGYEELSERSMLEWGRQSGLSRQGGYEWRTSADSPGLQFGVPALDSMEAKKLLSSVCPLLDKSFVLMGVKANLLPQERTQAISPFFGFKKVAIVAMGEPPAEQKEFAQKALLADKKVKAVAKAKREAADRKRKLMMEERKKKNEELRAAKRQKTEDSKDEGKEEEKAEEKEVAPAEVDEYVEPEVTLDDEEKSLCFRKSSAPDVSPETLSRAYANFSLPSAEEGFDEVRYAWASQAAAADHLRSWILARKKTQKVEGLQPSQWFKDEWSKWQKTVTGWKEEVAKAKKEGKEAKALDEVSDVLAVENVSDVGDGVPLCFNFKFEDWTLLGLRYELHLLTHAFRKDVNDEDRPTFTVELMPFYYGKYFKKSLTPKDLGMAKYDDVLELVKDSVEADGNSMVIGQLSEDAPLDGFLKRTEEHRRDRERRSDAGDETATLKFSRSSAGKGSKEKGSKGKEKGAGKSKDKGKEKGSGHKGGKPERESRPLGKGSSWSSGGKGKSERPGSGYHEARSSWAAPRALNPPPRPRPHSVGGYNGTAPRRAPLGTGYRAGSSFGGGMRR